MGRDLLEREPAFLAMIRRCDQALAQWASWSVEAELRSDASGSRLHLTEFAQPCIFAIQVAISECLRQWGVIPAAVVGHSMGEVAAAYCAGALDLESAVRVIHHRAQAMKDTLGQGRMLVVGLPAPTLQSRLANNPQLELSVVNSRNSCVVSGSPQAVQALDQQLRDEGIFTYLMPAEYAFHSCQMDECLTQIRAGLEDLPVFAAHTPWISTSAMPEEPILADADYWARNARGIVRFDRAIEQLIEQGHRLFVEIGPHTVLAASINQALADKGTQGLVCGALHTSRATPPWSWPVLLPACTSGAQVPTGKPSNPGRRRWSCRPIPGSRSVSGLPRRRGRSRPVSYTHLTLPTKA